MPGVPEAAKSSRPRTQGGRIPIWYVADRGRRTTTICSGVRHGGCFVRGSKLRRVAGAGTALSNGWQNRWVRLRLFLALLLVPLLLTVGLVFALRGGKSEVRHR